MLFTMPSRRPETAGSFISELCSPKIASEDGTKNIDNRHHIIFAKKIIILLFLIGLAYCFYEYMEERIPISTEASEKSEIEKLRLVQSWKIRWKNGKAGFVDTKGNWKIKPKFDDLRPFTEDGLACAQSYSRKTYSWGMINIDGEWQISPNISGCLKFSQGLSVLGDSSRGQGYIDKKYNWIIPAKFEEAENFSPNGMAMVKKNGKYGFIDKQGKWVIQPQFDDAHAFEDNLAIVKQGDRWGIINDNDQWVFEPQFDDGYFSFDRNGVATPKVNEKYKLINDKGKFISSKSFDYIGYFSEIGLAKAKLDDKYGYINLQGKWEIPPKYESADIFSEDGVACVKEFERNLYGCINRLGEYVIEPKYEEISSAASIAYARKYFSDVDVPISLYFASVKVNDKWGVIDIKGSYLVKPNFEKSIFFEEDDMAVVKYEDKYGLINSSADWVIKPKMDEISFLNNAFRKYKLGGKFGFIVDGTTKIRAQFDQAYNFEENNLAKVRQNGNWFYINYDGKRVKDAKQAIDSIDHYIIYDDGTVLDKKTNLRWKACVEGQEWKDSICVGTPRRYSWEKAKSIADNSSNWRLPTIEELNSLLYCHTSSKADYPTLHSNKNGCEGEYEAPTINNAVFQMKKEDYILRTIIGNIEWGDCEFWSSTLGDLNVGYSTFSCKWPSKTGDLGFEKNVVRLVQ